MTVAFWISWVTFLTVAITEDDLRLSGELRAGVKPAHPGAILSFESKHGPLRYSCDAFESATWRRQPTSEGWKQNLRAIAQALEALRKVDRYGISRGGEQYSGFKALGGSTLSSEAAAQVLLDYAGVSHRGFQELTPGFLVAHPEVLNEVYRAALKKAHPDTGGSSTDVISVTSSYELIRSMEAL